MTGDASGTPPRDGADPPEAAGWGPEAGSGRRPPAGARSAVRAAVVAAALALVAATADARTNASGGFVLEYPSDILPDANALAAAIQSPDVGTIVFRAGTNPFGGAITVFRRKGLTLCGATGRPQDVVLQTSATVGIQLDECTDVTIRDLTIRSTVGTGDCVRLQAVRSSSIEGFVRDVSVRNCRLEGFVGVRGTVRARGLEVVGCRIDVTRNGGAGIVWEDGPELLVTRTRFTNSATQTAAGAVIVHGATDAQSEGDRARRLILTRNTVQGDFVSGFDLADLFDARISGNRITFGSPTFATDDGPAGRAGIVVLRAFAAALTEDFEIRRNRVRGAHTGIWARDTGAGVIASNDVRSSGDPSGAADSRFGDTGAALRVSVLGPACQVTVDRNDLRNLRTRAPAPACIVSPPEPAAGCFPEGARNRLDPGRTLFQETSKR